MTKDDFLDDEAMHKLTGYWRAKKRIDQLRRMGIAFYVNAHGEPVVTRAAVEGAA